MLVPHVGLSHSDQIADLGIQVLGHRISLEDNGQLRPRLPIILVDELVFRDKHVSRNVKQELPQLKHLIIRRDLWCASCKGGGRIASARDPAARCAMSPSPSGSQTDLQRYAQIVQLCTGGKPLDQAMADIRAARESSSSFRSSHGSGNTTGANGNRSNGQVLSAWASRPHFSSEPNLIEAAHGIKARWHHSQMIRP
jgi:hypothetical protein